SARCLLKPAPCPATPRCALKPAPRSGPARGARAFPPGTAHPRRKSEPLTPSAANRLLAARRSLSDVPTRSVLRSDRPSPNPIPQADHESSCPSPLRFGLRTRAHANNFLPPPASAFFQVANLQCGTLPFHSHGHFHFALQCRSESAQVPRASQDQPVRTR